MKDILLADLLLPQLTRESALPLQRQIYDGIRRSVLAQHLLGGQKLPSSRALALDLQVSRITVSLAYDRLIAEGYLSAASGSGTFVVPGAASASAAAGGGAPRNGGDGVFASLSARGVAIGERSGGLAHHAGAFVPGVADASLFPFHIWRRLLSKYLAKSHLPLAGYAQEGAGFLPLREAISTYLGVSRSVNCTAEQVIITAGTNQSIDLCARLLTDDGDTVLVENPCHWAFPAIFAAAGVRVAAAALDADGLNVVAADFTGRTRVVVSSPSHQYPSGVVMPVQRRHALLEMAHKHDAWVIEDDYDSEFRYDGPPIPSLQSMDADARVIYMGTFSKAMFAGIRVSYLVVPAHIAAAFSNAVAQIYRPGQLHLQAALADFIGEGHLSQHIRKMRREYGERQMVLRAAMTHNFGSQWTLSSARAGLHLLATPNRPLNIARLRSEAAQEGLLIRQPSFVAPCSDARLRRAVVLGYGGVPTAAIDAGVAGLMRAWERMIA